MPVRLNLSSSTSYRGQLIKTDSQRPEGGYSETQESVLRSIAAVLMVLGLTMTLEDVQRAMPGDPTIV